MTGYFVTGTDTGVGKTFVTCSLAARAVGLGHRVFAFKPVETGCVTGPDRDLIGADQELLAQAAGNWQQGELRGLYRFVLPAAPLVAAEAAGAELDLDLIIRTAHQGAADHRASLTLVEGAGGWRVPITPTADMATLAAGLGYPVVIAARAGLGTINHTLLTVEAVRRDGLRIAAVVLSRRPEDDLAAAQRNRVEIRRYWPGLVLMLEQLPAALDPLLEGAPFPRST